MKKHLYIALIIMSLILLTGCNPGLKSIFIQGSGQIAVGDTATLTIDNKPIKSIVRELIWESSNEEVAKVENGVVTGISEGNVTITATANGKIKATKSINIYMPIESISMEAQELKLSFNEEKAIKVIVEPSNGSYKLINSSPDIVSLSTEGKVSANKYGRTRIVAQGMDGKNASCDVVVTTTVPNFNTMTETNAKKWGENNKVKIDTSSEYSDAVGKGKIISQSIAPNTEITDEGASIKIIYSLGHKATLGESNALKSANQYLRAMAFSAKGLKKQLEYEGYTSAEAQYGVDNCGADWNAQAAKSASQYLRVMSFSRKSLLDQLLYEGFTYAQAEYGVSSVGY